MSGPRDIPEPPGTGHVYGRRPDAWEPVLPLGGGNMSGPLQLWNTTPGDPREAASKEYVDSRVAGGGGSGDHAPIIFVEKITAFPYSLPPNVTWLGSPSLLDVEWPNGQITRRMPRSLAQDCGIAKIVALIDDPYREIVVHHYESPVARKWKLTEVITVGELLPNGPCDGFVHFGSFGVLYIDVEWPDGRMTRIDHYSLSGPGAVMNFKIAKLLGPDFGGLCWACYR